MLLSTRARCSIFHFPGFTVSMYKTETLQLNKAGSAKKSMGQKNGGWGMVAREASEGQLAHFCSLQRQSSSELWNPRGLFTTIVSEAVTDLYKEMVPTLSYWGPASPVEVRHAPQLAHLWVRGLKPGSSWGNGSPAASRPAEDRKPSGSGGWWGSPLPTQLSVSGFGSQALSDDSMKPHTPAHPFKVRSHRPHPSDCKWNPRKWMNTIFPKTHTISSSHRRDFSGNVSHPEGWAVVLSLMNYEAVKEIKGNSVHSDACRKPLSPGLNLFLVDVVLLLLVTFPGGKWHPFWISDRLFPQNAKVWDTSELI